MLPDNLVDRLQLLCSARRKMQRIKPPIRGAAASLKVTACKLGSGNRPFSLIFNHRSPITDPLPPVGLQL